jgi:ABC-type nitrate/sulfonate/bicarbonate transport system permease component
MSRMPGSRGRGWSTAVRLGGAAAGFGLWVLAWQWVTTSGPLADTYGLPTALATGQSALALAADAEFWSAVGQTLSTTVVATVVAAVIGLLIGIAMGMSTVVNALVDPVTQFLRPIPPVVLLPLVLLIVGPTTELAIILAVIGGIWPVLIQAHVGVRDVDPVAIETARSMSLSRRMVQTSVILPSAVPYFATGIRIATGLTLMLTIGAGILAGSPGLGRSIAVAQQSGEAATVFGMLLWAGVIGLVLNAALGATERALTRGRQLGERA